MDSTMREKLFYRVINICKVLGMITLSHYNCSYENYCFSYEKFIENFLQHHQPHISIIGFYS